MGGKSSKPCGSLNDQRTMAAVIRGSGPLKYNPAYKLPNSPKPDSNEVILRIKAAAINPVDYKAPKYILGPVAGLDVAGVVEMVGENHTGGLKVGDKVYGTALGSLAEYVLVSSKSLGKIPEGSSFEEAASMPTTYITALQGLVKYGKLKEGQSVLVIGASGGCGTAILQVAKTLNNNNEAGKLVGICSGKNEELVKSLGADEVWDYSQPGFWDTMKDAADEDKFDVVFDAATGSGNGESYKNWSLDRLKKNSGQYVSINGPMSAWLRKFTIGQKQNQHLFLTDMNTADLDSLSEMVMAEDSSVKPILFKKFAFNEKNVEEGFSLLKSRRAVGKIVFTMEENDSDGDN